MPHFSFEYSANLEKMTDIQELSSVIRQAAIQTGLFPMPGIRVRGFKADYYSIANGDEIHAFIDLSIRLREGRPQDRKEQATQAIFDAMKDYLQPVLNEHSLAVSVEMRDIDASLSPKTGTIRDHLPESSA